MRHRASAPANKAPPSRPPSLGWRTATAAMTRRSRRGRQDQSHSRLRIVEPLDGFAIPRHIGKSRGIAAEQNRQPLAISVGSTSPSSLSGNVLEKLARRSGYRSSSLLVIGSGGPLWSSACAAARRQSKTFLALSRRQRSDDIGRRRCPERRQHRGSDHAPA